MDALDRAVTEAVVEVVGEQGHGGIDIPDEGEMGRPGFSRYINQRLEKERPYHRTS